MSLRQSRIARQASHFFGIRSPDSGANAAQDRGTANSHEPENKLCSRPARGSIALL